MMTGAVSDAVQCTAHTACVACPAAMHAHVARAVTRAEQAGGPGRRLAAEGVGALFDWRVVLDWLQNALFLRVVTVGAPMKVRRFGEGRGNSDCNTLLRYWPSSPLAA